MTDKHKHGANRTEMENICTQVFRSVFGFCPVRDGAEAGTKYLMKRDGEYVRYLPDEMVKETTIYPVRHTISQQSNNAKMV